MTETRSARRLKGMLSTNLPPVSIEQMNTDIASAVAEANALAGLVLDKPRRVLRGLGL